MNNVALIGRLGKDPELKQTTSGKSVCNFSIAVENPFNRDEVAWIDCVVWNAPAEAFAKHMEKGRPVAVTGHLQQREYETKAGEKRRVLECVVHRWSFVPVDKSQATAHHDEDAPF